MTKHLRISDDGLKLPLEWMLNATVVYGARGTGKTVFSAVFAEEVHAAGQRFCAIDLKGDFYGLKSSRDGKSEGLPIIIFGGDHADVPLEPDAGEFVAETVASLDQSCALDFENMSKGKQVRFLGKFFSTLYHLNRKPLTLLLDEAQRYASQKPLDPDAAICLGAVEDLVKLGRKHALGVVITTQRGSSLNKEVSELCELLVAFRTPGPLDQERIKGWLDANATKADRDSVMSKLSGLPTGTAVFASGHPALKLFGVHSVRMRETFDSSATPKIGQRRSEPKRLAQPDLAALKEKMAAAIERARADDPKALRLELTAVKKELGTEKARAAALAVEVERVETALKEARAKQPKVRDVPALSPRDRQALERAITDLEVLAESLATGNGKASGIVAQVNLQIDEAHKLVAGLRDALAPKAPLEPPAPATQPRNYFLNDHTTHTTKAAVRRERAAARVSAGPGDASLSAALRKLLTALAQHPSGASRVKLGVLTGYRADTGHFGNMLSELRSKGLVVGEASQLLATDAGLEALGSYTPLPTGSALLEHWCTQRLAPAEAKILRAVCAAYPNRITRADLGERAGYRHDTGHFGNMLSKLRTLDLIEGSGEYLACAELFD
jgi:uncharacterized protein